MKLTKASSTSDCSLKLMAAASNAWVLTHKCACVQAKDTVADLLRMVNQEDEPVNTWE